MARGRPVAPGEVFYLGRIRWRPEDEPALLVFLHELTNAPPWAREKMIKRALAGGLTGQQATAGQAASVEDQETADILDGLMEGPW